MNKLLSRLPVAPRSLAAIGIAAVAAAFAADPLDWSRVGLVGLVVLIAAGLRFTVELPYTGSVALGLAGVIALTEIQPPEVFAAVTALGLFGAMPRPWQAMVIGASAAAALGAHQLSELLPLEDRVGPDLIVVTHVWAAGLAFVSVDLIGRALLLWRNERRLEVKRVIPLYVSLLCAAALLAVAWQRSAQLALVAAVPLLVTQYSFQRYAVARRTYAQTTQALSLLPEVAGMAPLGHAERTATYASALAEALHLEIGAVERIATAARLHHIGHISLDDPEARKAEMDPAEVGRVGGELLRDTGFLADIAALVEDAQDGSGPAETMEAAVIKVASTLDELVEGSANGADPFTEVLSHHPVGLERGAAIAMLQLHEDRPDLVAEARARTSPLVHLANVAASQDHTHDDDCR